MRGLWPCLLAALVVALAAASPCAADQDKPRARTAHQQQQRANHPPAEADAQARRERRDPVPDNTQDPWRKVPFNPDDVWEWIRRNNP